MKGIEARGRAKRGIRAAGGIDSLTHVPAAKTGTMGGMSGIVVMQILDMVTPLNNRIGSRDSRFRSLPMIIMTHSIRITVLWEMMIRMLPVLPLHRQK